MYYLKEMIKHDDDDYEEMLRCTFFETKEKLKEYLNENFNEIVVEPNLLIDLEYARNEIGYIENGVQMYKNGAIHHVRGCASV